MKRFVLAFSLLFVNRFPNVISDPFCRMCCKRSQLSMSPKHNTNESTLSQHTNVDGGMLKLPKAFSLDLPFTPFSINIYPTHTHTDTHISAAAFRWREWSNALLLTKSNLHITIILARPITNVSKLDSLQYIQMVLFGYAEPVSDI